MPVFEGIARFAAAGCLVKPLYYDFFQADVDFELPLKIQRQMNRPYDGWFHSSVHPAQDEHDLWVYLAHPERVKRKEFGYIGGMATMFGTVVGEVLKEATRQAGVSVPPPAGRCPACGQRQPLDCREHGACHEPTRSRGHLDDILDFGSGGVYGLDNKTIKPFGLKDAPDMDPEFFRQKWPRYFAQGQDYMRMTGLRKFIYIFLGLGTPWEMREYHLEFDPVFAFGIEQKYRRVIEAWQDGGIL
jgi:hypothetical protein